jgi:hypothetical protein
MEVNGLLETEARLKASEKRLVDQQRNIDSNSLLLQALQTQHTNAQVDKVTCDINIKPHPGKQCGYVTWLPLSLSCVT